MVYIVLPAYNEEEGLVPLLEEIKYNMEESSLSYRVIDVDDGSTDNSCALVEEISRTMPVTLLKHPQNRGLTETVKTGLFEAVRLSQKNDIIITMDADNTHSPGLIMRMVRMIREGYDVVIASRYLKDSRVIGVPFFRQILSLGASFLCRVTFPIRGVRDYTSGYRAYRAQTIKEMFDVYGKDFIDQPGFACMIDILLKLRSYPLMMGEVPLILRYDQKHSTSKMNVRFTILQTLSLLLRRRFNLK